MQKYELMSDDVKQQDKKVFILLKDCRQTET